ncbi:MAG: tandem-95 repeat protein, partial [Candidatus Anammoximicrobium sp.]|nr:tandem-95 repeat protein [Candidatus Anammoximicrobium sp.]
MGPSSAENADVVTAPKGGPGAPVLHVVHPVSQRGSGQVYVEGEVDVPARVGQVIRIEFFSVHGKSAQRLGQIEVRKDAAGPVPFQAVLDTKLNPNEQVVARASGDYAGSGGVSLAVQIEQGTDRDRDGIDDQIETRGPRGGDANRDGVPDSRQSDVVSLPSRAKGKFVTLDGKGHRLSEVYVSALPDRWAGRQKEFPFGQFEFVMEDVPVGEVTRIDVLLPEGDVAAGYYKLEPETQRLVPFVFDGDTGAVVSGNMLTLFLRDGGRGDADGVANGIIVDPGIVKGGEMQLISKGASGLDGWTIQEFGGSESFRGNVSFENSDPETLQGNSFLVMSEGDSYLVTLETEIEIPADPTWLRFEFYTEFDETSQGFIKDAFEVALLDEAGQPLVPPFRQGRDAYFNWTEGEDGLYVQPAVEYSGQELSVNLSGLEAGSTARLVFRLINEDGDTGSEVIIDTNVAPLAYGDQYSVKKNVPLTVSSEKGILVNDKDPDRDSLLALLVQGPQHGSLTLRTDGGFTYTPDAGFEGTDTFTYKANDEWLDSEGATVTLAVTPNYPPVLEFIGNRQTDEGQLLSFTVSASDPDLPGNTLTLGAEWIGHEALPDGANFEQTGPSSGLFTWTPSEEQGWGAYEGIRFWVADNGDPQLTDSETISITVYEVNLPPVLNAIGNKEIFEGNELSFTATASDPDVPANTLRFSATRLDGATTELPAGATLNAQSGLFRWTPAATQGPGTYTLSFTVTDNGSPWLTDRETITITVHETQPDSATTAEDAAVTVAVLGNDTIAGSASVTSVTPGAHGAVVINPDSTVTYTPDADWYGTDSFTYAATSGGGVTGTAVVTVTVAPGVDIANDAATTDEDAAVVIAVLSNDTFEGTPSVAAVTQGAHGAVVVNPDNTVTYTPTADWNGSDTFTYTTMSAGVTETATVTVTVGPVADIVDDTDSTAEDTAVIIAVLANDTFEGTPAVTGVTPAAHGAVVINPDNTVMYTPAADWHGSDSFGYTVTSGGVPETATVTVTVAPVADVVDDAAGTDEDAAVTIAVLSNDTFAGQASVTAVTQGTHGTVVMNADNTVTYTPAADWHGTDSFSYTATAAGLTQTATVTVSVGPVADVVHNAESTDEDAPVTIAVLANDTFAGTASVTAVTQGVHGTVVINGGSTLTYTPAPDWYGTDSFSYTATSAGLTETATVTVSVAPVVDIVDDTDGTDEDTAVTIAVLANDTFEAAASVTSVTQGAHGMVAINPDHTVTYTPAPDWYGTDSFSYTASSGGVPETATVSVTVAPVADILGDTATTDEDTAMTIAVLGNDTFEGTPSVTGVTPGAHGAVVINEDGTVTYTPAADWNGSDSFSYTATSGGRTETATVSVTVSAVADIVEDTAETTEDSAATIAVLTNDMFEATASVTSVTQGAHGAVVINADNTVTYTPVADWNGADSFSYAAASGGVTETAVITVTVAAVADIVADTAATKKDTAVTVAVLANDTFEGTPSVTAVTQGAHGAVVINADSTVTYTPVSGYYGPDSFTYTASSGGVTEVATVNVTITSAVADTASTGEDMPVSVAVLANDVFAGTPSVSGVTQGGHGTVVINGDSTVTYTPAADWHGTDSFAYTATSGGVTDTATVTVTVTAVADIVDDAATTDEDTAVTISVLTNDTFEGAPSVTGVTPGAHGTVVINADNTVTYAPAADWHGTDSFQYTVTSAGSTETATVTVTVAAIADVVDDTGSTDEDTAVTIGVLANDAFAGTASVTGVTQGVHGAVVINPDNTVTYTPAADWHGTDSFSYTASSAGSTETATVTVTVAAVADIVSDAAATPEDTAVTIGVLANDTFEGTPSVTAVTQGAHGTVVVNPDNTVTYTPAADWNGADSFQYAVTSAGLTETATVTMTVTPVADVVNDTDSTEEHSPVTIAVLANDTFAGTPSVTAVTQGVHGTVVINGDSTLTYTPAPDWYGTDSFSYTATSAGLTETATVTVSVAPVVDIVDDADGTDEDTPVTIGVLTNDTFEAAASVTSVTQGAHGTVAINPDHTVTYTPAADWHGTDTFTYTASSGGVPETATVSVTVAPVADILGDTATTNEDTAVTIAVLGNDTFEGTPSVTGVTPGAHGAVVINGDGTVTYTPAADWNGSDSFSYTATSGGRTETATVSVTVSAVADIVEDAAETTEDGAATIAVLTNDTFEAAASVSSVTQGAHGTVVINADNTVTYTPVADWNGADSFSYTATSGGLMETAVITVTVAAVADIVADTAATKKDTAVTMAVLGNDTFEGMPSVTAVTQGAHGAVVINADSTVTYTPVSGYYGSDSFTYTASSGGVTEVATVSVTVTSAVADTASTGEDTPVSVAVLANDVFAGTPSVSGVTQGGHGTVVINGDNTVTYTPAADWHGTDSFTYTAASGGVTDTATVTVTVSAVADIVDDAATTDEDTAVTVNVLTNDTFEGAPSVTGVAQGAHGTVVINPDNTVTYTPAADWHGTDSFSYTASSAGSTETATVTVTVAAV